MDFQTLVFHNGDELEHLVYFYMIFVREDLVVDTMDNILLDPFRYFSVFFSVILLQSSVSK